MFFQKKKISVVDDRLKHIAFIMDGNGRWAQKRMLPRSVGHKYGADTFKKVVRYCFEMGIKVVTVYAFSTENWKRPQQEIDAIIKLLKEYILDGLNENDVRINFIGDKKSLPDDLAELMTDAELKTKEKTKLLNIAFNYGGRNEIVNACNNLIKTGKEEITEQDISDNIYTAGMPEPDLIVRTAGEYRLSNFLLWQSAYSELYFTNVYWPEFDKKQLNLAIKSFYKRKRRFGGLNTKEGKKWKKE